MFTTVVTNVPGPPVPIYSCGARLESQMGLVCLTDGMGLGHVVQSYTDEATISFTACRELLPDPEFYIQCIEDSFNELRDAAKNAPADSKPKEAPQSKAKAPAKKPAAKKTAAKKTTATKPAAKKRAPAKKATANKNTPAKSTSKGTKGVASRSKAAPKGKGTPKS